MMSFGNLKKPLAITLVSALLSLSMTSSMTQAAMVGTREVLKENYGDLNRERLYGFLDRTEVRARLEAKGIDPEIARAQIDALTDEELATIVDGLDRLPAGGDPIGAIVGAAVLVFIILLITDILGLTDVFPFVKKHR